jgi:Flp pilus assembly pilin Flp
MARLSALRSFVIRAIKATGEAGASLVEYTLLVALIAAVAIGAVMVLGNGAKDTLCDAGNTIANAGAATPVDSDCTAP